MVHIQPREPVITTPAFCPNQNCPCHNRDTAADTDWFVRFGSFFTKARGAIQRFRCRRCGTTCSTQTFSTHYWTHSTGDLKHLEYQLTSCSGLRQIGRMNGYSYRVVKNRTHRLARQYLTLFAHALDRHTPTEDMAYDGFESYMRSQYFPTNINILIGCESQACYGFNQVVMRRKGRMTRRQKEIRRIIDQVWRPRRKALENATFRLFSDLLPAITRAMNVRKGWTLFSDEKQEYPRALRRIPAIITAMNEKRMIHRRISSTLRRTVHNLLFPVNYIDREIRKDMGEHVRETVKQPREVNCSLERMVIKLGSHTFNKPHRIRGKVYTDSEPRHATVAGFDRKTVVAESAPWIHTCRQVYSHLPGEARDMGWIREIWQRMGENPPIIDVETGKPKPKGQPKELWFARHLLV